MSTEYEEIRPLPILALRGLNIFPGMLLNFDVERSQSVAALNFAMSDDHIIFLATQKDIADDMPEPDDVYQVGTVCRIRQLVRQPGNRLCKVMVEGLYRGFFVDLIKTSPHFYGVINPLPDAPERCTPARTEALIRTAV